MQHDLLLDVYLSRRRTTGGALTAADLTTLSEGAKMYSSQNAFRGLARKR